MKRLWFTILNDFRLQWRNGFYTVMGITLGFWILLRTQTSGLDLSWVMGVFVAGNLLITGFYFIAALVLLEKEEGTLTAQVVTPLRPWEYLFSKTVSLFVLGLFENLVIVLLYNGPQFHWGLFVAGTFLVFLLYLCCGLIMVTRYDSINGFLFPSVLAVVIIILPLIGIVMQSPSRMFYLHPMQAGMVILNGAFVPQPGWVWGYAFGYILVTLCVLGWLTYRMTKKAIFVGGC